MRILILANFYKTPFWLGVAELLVKQGHQVDWVSPSHKWASFLQGRVGTSSRVYDLSAAVWPRDPVEASFSLESALSHFPIPFQSLIEIDRRLARRSEEFGVRYLASVAEQMDGVFGDSERTVVLGEATWAWELVAAAVAKKHGNEFWVPHTLRIPDDRFALFEGVFQDRPSNALVDETVDIDFTRRSLVDLRQREPKPFYWSLRTEAPSLDWKVVRLAAEKFVDALADGPGNPTQKPLVDYLRFPNRISDVLWSRQVVAALESSTTKPPKEPYALLTLHRQPEASIDVLGWNTRDQIRLAHLTADALPVGWNLYVKEHINALGDRPGKYIAALADHPRVRLVQPRADTWGWIRGARLIVTVSGTVGYEAGLLGKPVVTTSPMFFGTLPSVHHIYGYGGLSLGVTRAIECGVPTDAQIVDSYMGILRHSAVGLIGDIRTLPKVMDSANLKRVSVAIDSALAKLVV